VGGGQAHEKKAVVQERGEEKGDGKRRDRINKENKSMGGDAGVKKAHGAFREKSFRKVRGG